MQSPAEHILVRSFRSILADLPTDAAIPDSAEFRSALNALEFYVPEVLAEIHPEWHREGLDEIIPRLARKVGERDAEILGLGILLSDQSATALHLHLQIAPATDVVSWFECKIGERNRDGMGMVRMPYETVGKQLQALESRLESIKWVYSVTFGPRDS